jgi:hypothetical protein
MMVVMAGLLGPAAQAASTATVYVDSGTAFYRAGWNEQNHVRVWLTAEGHMVIYDSGATVLAIPDPNGPDMCTQLSAHKVDCGTVTGMYGSLNNGDDWASFDIFQPQYAVSWNGGAGQDFLRGGAGADTIIGAGDGSTSPVTAPWANEVAYGRGGNDTINEVSYADGGPGTDRCAVFPWGSSVRCEG